MSNIDTGLNEKFKTFTFNFILSSIGVNNIKTEIEIKKECVSTSIGILSLLTGLYFNSKIHYGKHAWETEAYNDNIIPSILTASGLSIFIESLSNYEQSKTEILFLLFSLLKLVYGCKRLHDIKAPRDEHREGKKCAMMNGGLIGIGIGLIAYNMWKMHKKIH